MRVNCGKSTLSVLRQYCYSTQTGARPTEKVRLVKEEGKVTRLPNGVAVASVENLSPIVRIAYVFNAGSRYETSENAGITHTIRRAAGLANKKYSNFGTIRNLQQIGATLTCSTTKEQIIYSVDCLRSQLPLALDIVSNAALWPEFKPWEISDNNEYVKLDLKILEQQPDVQVQDLLHKAAYRTTLGNPVNMPHYQIGKHTTQQLKSFVDTHYTAGNLSIIVVGADHDSLLMINRRGELHVPTRSEAVKPQKAKYHGGELRVENDNELVHVAVASEGVALSDENALALSVLEHILGSSYYIKYSNGAATSKIAQAVVSATKAPFFAKCINASYTDSGLFGFHLVTHKDEIGKALKSVIGTFGNVTKGGITENDVKNAKLRLKAAMHMSNESSSEYLFSLSRQVGLSGQIFSSDKIEAAIDKVTLQDVQNVAKKVVLGKPSLAAVGDLSNTPHLDELKS